MSVLHRSVQLTASTLLPPSSGTRFCCISSLDRSGMSSPAVSRCRLFTTHVRRSAASNLLSASPQRSPAGFRAPVSQRLCQTEQWLAGRLQNPEQEGGAMPPSAARPCEACYFREHLWACAPPKNTGTYLPGLRKPSASPAQ